MLLFVFPDQTNFTVSPVDIFEGDTVRLTCQINSTSQNVTWYYCDQIISTGLQYLIERNISTKTSWSTLEIINITMKDNGMIFY